MTEEQYRLEVAAALARNDKNKSFSDMDSATEGTAPMTLDEVAAIIARMFSEALHSALGPDLMEEVVRRNDAERHPNICHSHDFCDANQVLIDVFEQLGLDPLPQDEAARQHALDLCNALWRIARANRF